MKTALLLVFTLAFSVAMWADHAPYPYNSIPVNGSTGIVNYLPNVPSIYGSGTTYYGGSVIFTASGFPTRGRFASGTLDIQSSVLVVSGTLSNVFFNLKTGLLQGQFAGTIWYNGSYIQKCIQHRCTNGVNGNFYESINLSNHSMNWGRLVYSTAPEPNGLLLLATGLACIALYQWKRRFQLT